MYVRSFEHPCGKQLGTCGEVLFNVPNRTVRNLHTDLNSNSVNIQDKKKERSMQNSENPVIFRHPFTLINVVMTSSDAVFAANCV
jgi:DNA topoisomerase VI subunit A